MENNKRRSIKNLREILGKKPETYKAKHYKKSRGFVRNNRKREGCHFKEYVEKQKYQEQNLNSSISKMNEEKPEMTAEEEKTETTAGEEKTELVAGKENPETPAGQEKPETTAGKEKPEMVARKEKTETTAGEEKPEMTAEEEKPEMAAEEEKTEMTAEEEKPEMAAGEEKPEMVAGKEKPETTAGEEKPEMVAGKEKPEMTVEEEKPEMIVGEEKIILEKDMSEATLALAEKIYLPRPNTFEKEFPRLSRIFPRLSISRFGVSLLKFKLRLKRARKNHKNIEEKTEIGYYDKEEAKQKYKEKFKVDGLEKSSIGNKNEKEQESPNYEKDDNEER